MGATGSADGHFYPMRPPELLFHSVDAKQFAQMIQSPIFTYGARSVYASRILGYAWQVAHRTCLYPHVAIIDVPRAIAQGATFTHNAKNLWESKGIPTESILNAHPNFEEQVSAGGFPLFVDNGVPKVALIRMQRHTFVTWEISKGKLDLGESPEQAAKREIQEEMGCVMDLHTICTLGMTQFALHTEHGEPKLKTLYVYLFESTTFPQEFHCATSEGILDVQWFDIPTALSLVTHNSLKRIMKKLTKAVDIWMEQRKQDTSR